MKNFFFISFLTLGGLIRCFSQKDTSKVDINFLKAPASPAANLLGTAPTEIQTPSDPGALVASFQNATNNLTSLPKSFAVDIAPFWFFGGRNRTFSEYNSNKLKNNLKQSLVVSIAFRDSSSALKGYKSNSMIGFGFKVSLSRGRSNAEADIARFNQLANTIDSLINFDIDQDPRLMRLNAEADSLQLAGKSAEAQSKRNEARLLEESIKPTLLASINTKARIEATLKTQESFRTGFKWDVAGGFSYRYPLNSIDSATFFRGGLWTTFGWEGASKDKNGQWSALFMLRGLQNPNQPWADAKGILKGKSGVTTGDIGFKTSYVNISKHTIAATIEILYRSILSKQDEKSLIAPSWRAAFNANYEVNKNIVLSLAIGRDFDGSISKSGNVFAFLNLITAFGSGTSISTRK